MLTVENIDSVIQEIIDYTSEDCTLIANDGYDTIKREIVCNPVVCDLGINLNSNGNVGWIIEYGDTISVVRGQIMITKRSGTTWTLM